MLTVCRLVPSANQSADWSATVSVASRDRESTASEDACAPVVKRQQTVTIGVCALLLLLSTYASALVHAQTDTAERPRRTQTPPTITEDDAPKAPSLAATAEAKRLYKAGVKYGNAGLYRQAADNFEQAIKLNPNYSEAYFSLGHAYTDLTQWEQAIASLERGLTLKPKDKEGLRQLAYARAMLARETRNLESGRSGQPDGSRTSLNNTGSALASKTIKSSDLTKLYRVGPGDVLEVRFTDASSAQPMLLTVTPGGLLEHPDLGSPLLCAGLTVEEIAARIENDLKRRSKTANVSVAVSEYISHTILVSGLVKEPGVKSLKREAIPLYVVVADAQPLPEADSVTVLRHDANETYVIDLAKPAEMNMLVRPRDVVTLQTSPTQFFYVSGEVKSPGEKNFRRGLTLTQAIIAAGGLNKDAKEARLARDNGKGFLSVNRYKLKDVDSGKIADPLIQPGDRITIIK